MDSRGRLALIHGVWLGMVVLLLACGTSGWKRPAAAGSDGVTAGSRPLATGDDERWLELQSPHFILHTDLFAARATELAKQLELIRTMLLRAVWPKARDPGGRTHVVIFARPADFQRYSGMKGTIVGAAITRPGLERTIAFSPGPEGGVPSVAVHELVHDLSQWFFPLQPAWFAEGLAVFLENTRYDGSSGQVVVGEASKESLRWLKSVKFFASSRMLFESTNPHSDDPQAVATFYVGSWFLVTYLLNGEDEAFGRFQKQLHQLVPWRRAWDEAFDGMTPATLDEKLQAYARQGGNLSIFTFEMAPPPIEPRLRALSSAEAHGVKALLASAAAPEVAEREMQAALALDPDDLAALSVQFRATPAHPPEPRARIAQRAVAAHPEAGEAWFLSATAAPDQESRERALKRAAALEPSHPGVALLVAGDALQQGKFALALERSRFVLQRSALSPNGLALYAAALEATGRCSESAILAANASALFDSSCRVGGHAMGELIDCAAYVQSRVGSSIASCKGPKRAARARE